MWRLSAWCCVLGVALVFAPSANASIIVAGDSADSVIRKDGSRLIGPTGRLGAGTTIFAAQQGGRDAVYVFKLPTPNPGEQFVVGGARFQFTIVADKPDGSYNIDLYGLGARTAPDVLAGDYYAGALDSTDATLIQNDLIPSAHPDHGVEAVTTSASANLELVNYLNAQYGASVAGVGRYAFLRLNPDLDPPNEDTGVDVAFAENSTGTPQLTISFVPEPGIVLPTFIVLVAYHWRRGRRD